MVFKKDLTPLTKKGSVTKHSGKGSAERRPDVMAQVTNRYPKAAPVVPAAAATAVAPPLGPFPMGPPPKV